eukprot:SM000018S03594  [mRNA]  locus=s18:193592:194582:+ [translate_table: standard]
MASVGSSPQWIDGLKDVWRDKWGAGMGALCPCVLFAQNVFKLSDGEESFYKACLMHALLGGVWGTALCCVIGPVGYLFTCVPCYAAKYRKRLRDKYGLPELPMTDLKTHFLCHPCALCQEYRQLSAGSTEVVRGPTKATIDRHPPETEEHLKKQTMDR